MSRSDRDVTRVVRSWLDEGVTALPDRVLDAVLDQVAATPQYRASWLVRRFPIMNNNLFRFGLAAAAVIVIALVGIRFLPGSGSPGGPPTPTPTPTPPAPLPSESLPAGSYTVTNAGFTLVPYTFTVPAGWIRDDGGARRGPDPIDSTAVRLSTWIITHVYADSCHWTGTLVPVADKAALVAALTAQVGHDHSTPVETTIGGLPATQITLSLDAAFDVGTCDTYLPTGDQGVRLWPDPGPDESGGFLIVPGQTDKAFVIEANGQVMVLMTVQRNDSPAADVAELQQILDSVEFHP